MNLIAFKTFCIWALCLFTCLHIQAQSIDIVIEVTPDCWAPETGWKLVDSNGNTIAYSDFNTYNYQFPNGPGTYFNTVSVLDGECYTYTIYDSWGDGMTGASYGSCSVNGYFQIVDILGNQITELDSPNFGTSAEFSFCISGGCTDPNAVNYSSSPNAMDNSCVYQEPEVNFSFSEISSGCGQTIIQFENNSLNGNTSLWSFPDANQQTSDETNPTATFPTGGTFPVTLQVSNAEYSASITQNITTGINEQGSIIRLVIEPDCWASELSWQLTDEDGNSASGNSLSYPNEFPAPQFTIEDEFCVQDGCYTLTLNDAYGDGMLGESYSSCDVSGTFYIESYEGDLIYEYTGNANWGSQLQIEVCFNEEFIWRGTSDDDWFNPSNWLEQAVPSSGDNVRISTFTFNPKISGQAKIARLVIEEGSTIEFANSSSKLTLTRDLINLGILDLYEGMIEFAGDETQYIKSSEIPIFYKFKINKEDSLKLQTESYFRGPIILSEGIFDFNGFDVTLTSDSDYTGSIGRINEGSDIEGDEITIERFFPAGSGSWRMLCTSITNATFEQWADDFPTTGFEGSDYPDWPSAAEPWSNIRYYKETFFEGEEADKDFGFTSASSINDQITNSIGYFVYIVPSPTLIDVTGEFGRGEVSFDLDYTDSNGDDYNDGWNLVANPYPSAIDWDQLTGWSKDGVYDAIYAYDPIASQYSSYVNGISVGQLNNEIASSQSFWVKAHASDASLTINEAAKTNASGVFMRSQDYNTVATVRIVVESGNYDDDAVLGFNASAQTGFDGDLDAFKFYTEGTNNPNLSIIPDSTGKAHAISIMPIPDGEFSVGLHVIQGASQNLTIRNDNIDAFEENYCFYLEDKLENVKVPFDEGDTYEFVADVPDMKDRFFLHVKPPALHEVTNESCPQGENGLATIYPTGEGPFTISWYNEMGQSIQESTGVDDFDTLEDLIPGYYHATVSAEQEHCGTSEVYFEVEAAPESYFNVDFSPTECNTPGSGMVAIDLSDDYVWDIQFINSETNELLQQFEANANMSDENVDAGIFTIIATNSCGDVVEIEELDLRDPNMIESKFTMSADSINVFEASFVQLSNETEGMIDFMWDFGDGSSDSTHVNIQHSYFEPGIYEIKLWTMNFYCEHEEVKTIFVYDIQDEEEEESGLFAEDNEYTINPLKDEIGISAKRIVEKEILIGFYNSAGQLVFNTEIDNVGEGEQFVSIANLAAGVYYIHIIEDGEVMKTEKFIKN